MKIQNWAEVYEKIAGLMLEIETLQQENKELQIENERLQNIISCRDEVRYDVELKMAEDECEMYNVE